MVENDFRAQDQERRERSRRVGRLTDEYRYSASEIITYDTFKSRYWPRMSSNVTRRHGEFKGRRIQLLSLTVLRDPAVVFGQIVGIIEGCERTLENGGSPLDRDTYEGLRTQNMDYALYEAYSSLKEKWHERDAADRQVSGWVGLQYTHDLPRR